MKCFLLSADAYAFGYTRGGRCLTGRYFHLAAFGRYIYMERSKSALADATA